MPDETPHEAERQLTWRSIPPVRYPNSYVWFVFFSALDVMLTWKILLQGGTEVNPIADVVIQGWGLAGAILFKFSLTVFVILICEVVGRKRDRLGRTLAGVAVALSAIPVVYSLSLLVYHYLIVGTDGTTLA
jgi:hypothetical protein